MAKTKKGKKVDAAKEGESKRYVAPTPLLLAFSS